MLYSRIGAYILRLIPALVLVFLWELVARNGFLNPALFPPPLAVFKAFVAMLFSGELITDSGATIGRAFAGFFIGSAFGVFAGAVTARIRVLDISFGNIVQLLRPIPPVAIVPLVVVWLGLGEISKLFIVGWGVFFPVWVNTYVGVKGVDEKLICAAMSLGANRWRTLLRVVLPAALPHVIAGMRVAVALALICVVVAEMIGAYVGLGFRINVSYLVFRVDRMLAALIVLGFLGAISDRLFVTAVAHIMPWYSVE